MQRTILKGILTAALIGSVALPALAQDMGERTPVISAPKNAGPANPEPRHGVGHPGIDLAARLSALETFVGITAEQLPAWRTYTDALLAFTESARPVPGEARHGDGPRPGSAGQETPDGRNGASAAPAGTSPGNEPQILLFAERLADQALARSEKAGELKTAAANLRAALSPEQLARLIEAEAPPRTPAHAGPRPGPGTNHTAPDHRDADRPAPSPAG